MSRDEPRSYACCRKVERGLSLVPQLWEGLSWGPHRGPKDILLQEHVSGWGVQENCYCC